MTVASRGFYRPNMGRVDPYPLVGGFSNGDRSWAATTNAAATGTQVLRLSYFTAPKSLLAASVRMMSGGTAAGATPTIVRIGIYSEAANGDLTLIGSTPNDTALFAAAATAYTKALSVSTQFIEGSRYATGLLVVTAAAAPSIVGVTFGGFSISGTDAPRLTAHVSGQANLPSSVAVGSLTAGTVFQYCSLLS